MKKRFISILLACALIICMRPAVSAAEDTAFEGYTPISTKEELDAVRNNLAGNYYLTQDIVFTEEDFAEGGAFPDGWDSIGYNSSNPFSGTFDGNGYAIVGLQCTSTGYVGLFWL